MEPIPSNVTITISSSSINVEKLGYFFRLHCQFLLLLSLLKLLLLIALYFASFFTNKYFVVALQVLKSLPDAVKDPEDKRSEGIPTQ